MTRPGSIAHAFTLLEVMIAIAVIGIAMLALLALHRQNIEAVIRAQNLTRAAMLAQGLMSEAETEGFPPLGVTKGDFSKIYPGSNFSNFRWERTVDPSPVFPTICRVRVRVFYGPGFHNSFEVVEFLRNANPLGNAPALGANGGAAGGFNPNGGL